MTFADGTLVRRDPSLETFVIYGGARFQIPTAFELEHYPGTPLLMIPSLVATIPTIPVDGTVLRERNRDQAFVVIGGSRFRLNNVNIWNGQQHVVPDGALLAIPQAPRDGLVVKEVSAPKVFVFAGGVAFWIPDPTELIDHFGGWGAVQLVPDGSLESYRQPRPGSLCRESDAATVFVFEPTPGSTPGVKYAVSDPTSLATYGGWGAVQVVPRQTMSAFPDGGPAPATSSVTPRPNGAAVVRRRGKIETDIELSSLPVEHTIMLRFLLQFPRAKEQCLFSSESEGSGHLSLTHLPNGRLRLRVAAEFRDYAIPHPDRATAYEAPTGGFPSAAPPIAVPRWHHVAVANSKSGYRLYLEGLEVLPESGSPMTAGTRSGRLQLGQYALPVSSDNQFQFFGLLDDLAVFGSVVAASTIVAIAQMPRLTGLEPSLVATISFDGALSGVAGDRTPTFVGEAWSVPVSADRDAQADQGLFPLPNQGAAYSLPFKPAEVWRVAQEFASEGTHQGWFAWDFGRVPTSRARAAANGTASGPYDDLDPTEGNRVLAVAPGLIVRLQTPLDGSHTITWQTGPEDHAFVEHLRVGSFRVAVGDSVGSSSVLAQAGASGMPGGIWPHLHLSAQEAIGSQTLATSIPIAFSNYDVSRDYGRTWQSVPMGMPRVGEWIRRPGSPVPITDPLCDSATGGDRSSLGCA